MGRMRTARRERPSRLDSGLRRSAGLVPAAFSRPAVRPRPFRPALAAAFAAVFTRLLAVGEDAAQTSGTLVSNINQAASTNIGIGQFAQAQGFTTDANSNDHILDSVGIDFHGSVNSTGVVRLVTGVSTRSRTFTEVATLSNAGDGFRAAGRPGEIGYGLPAFGGSFTGTSNLDFTLRRWRAGLPDRLAPDAGPRGQFRLRDQPRCDAAGACR